MELALGLPDLQKEIKFYVHEKQGLTLGSSCRCLVMSCNLLLTSQNNLTTLQEIDHPVYKLLLILMTYSRRLQVCVA
jgi:hypothetical protein